MAKPKNIYCVKCKGFIENTGKMTKRKLANGRKYVTVKCKRCGIFKSSFI